MVRRDDSRRAGASSDAGREVPFPVPGNQRTPSDRSGGRAGYRSEAAGRDRSRTGRDARGSGTTGVRGSGAAGARDSGVTGARGSGAASVRGGRGSARHASHAPSGSRNALAAIAVILVVLLAAAFAIVHFVIAPNSEQATEREGAQVIEASDTAASSSSASDSEAGSSGGASDGSAASDAPTDQVRDLAPLSLLSVPGSDSVISIALDNDAFSSEACGFDTSAIQAAVANVEELGDCGFVFLDVGSGRGISYHADVVTYIASSSKAVLAQYALLSGAEGDEQGRYNIEAAILYSDNDAYEGFGYVYADGGYGDWLDQHQAWFDNYTYDLYPPMSARSLASFWAETLKYLRTGSESAQWFGDLLGSTSTSFIRDGIASTGAHVMNKAGWIGEEGYESVTDAGIIDVDGRTYILAIVTGQFDGEMAEGNVSDLARAIFDVRGQLQA